MVGLGISLTAESPDPVRLGRMAEERGFESFLLPEHTHIPLDSGNGPDGRPLTPEHSGSLDPFVALAAMAAGTERLLVGTGICLVTQRDPIVTAKETATLDHVSGGRFLFGVGAGWNRAELRNHGTDPATRFAVMRERVEAITRIWTEDEASYHGEHVSFDALWSWPKPVRKPHPPILVGGNGPTVIDRVLAYGDEWMPMGVDESFGPRFEELHRRAAEAGRTVGITAGGIGADPRRFDWLARAGVHRALHWLPNGPTDVVERAMDACADAVGTYRRAGS